MYICAILYKYIYLILSIFKKYLFIYLHCINILKEIAPICCVSHYLTCSSIESIHEKAIENAPNVASME